MHLWCPATTCLREPKGLPAASALQHFRHELRQVNHVVTKCCVFVIPLKRDGNGKFYTFPPEALNFLPALPIATVRSARSGSVAIGACRRRPKARCP